MRPILLLALAACGPAEPDLRALDAPVPAPWSRPDERPALDHAFFAENPALADLSLFAQEIDADADPSHRADLGVGNGRAFAMLALQGAAHGLHGIVGPTYRKGDRFFGDVALQLLVDDEPTTDTRAWVGRPRGTSALVTRTDTSGGTLFTVDVAPRPAGMAPDEVPPVIQRVLLLRAGSAGDYALRLDAVDALTEVDGVPTIVLDDGRALAAVPGVFAAWELRDEAWVLPIGSLAAGEEVEVHLRWVFASDVDALADEIEAWSAATPAHWIADTLAADAAYLARGVQLDVDDPWLLDWLDGMLISLRTQTTPAGGITPMSRYTGTWLRDSIGPARFWARAGRVDEARAAAAYLHLCHRFRGDIGNACESGLLPDDVVGEPDWDAMGEMGGRTAAEGPSHIPLVWREVVRWGGDAGQLAPLWPYLRRSLLDQQITDDGLQPWSGDETFRLAMNVAFDQPLEVPWQDTAWSSNSGLLMVGAARWLGQVAPAAGHPEDAAALQALSDLARAGLDAFVRPEGHLAALILRDPELAPLDLPFEDAALAGIWSGGLAPDDPFAISTLEALLDQVGRGDGTVQSPAGPSYDLGAFAQGFATGMLPGYVLWDLAATGHAEADDAFAQVLAYSSPSGQLPEGLSYHDKAAFQPIYDAIGRLGDTAARYRPWEGGIVADAVLMWLLGAEPVDGGLRLRPRAPSGLDRLSAGPVTAPGASAHVEVRWVDGWEVEVRSDAEAAFALTVEIPLGVHEDVDVVPDGPVDGELVVLPLGERMVRFAPVTIAPGETLVFAARNPT